MADEPEHDEQPETERITVDAADPKAVRKQRVRKRLSEKDAQAFWRDSLSTPAGRRELWLILQNCGTFEENFACGPNGFPQPEATWHAAGRKSVGQQLFRSWLKLERDGVWAMLDENDPAFAKPQPVSKTDGVE